MTPEKAIRAWLRQMGEASRAEQGGGAARGATRFQALPPVLSSMEIIKRRTVPGRQVCVLTYLDSAGSRRSWTVRLIEDDHGTWQVCGGGGGSGDGPERDHPWVNLAGSWGRYGLALGGPVRGRGSERAASATLRIGDSVLVDDVDRGVVLFVTSEAETGSIAIVDLLAQDGSSLWRDELQLDD